MAASLARRSGEVKGTLAGLRSEAEEQTSPISAEDVGDLHDRFLLWAGNLGALRNPSSRLSLDRRLSEAPEVRRQILQQFDDIAEAADDRQSASFLGGCARD